MQGRYYTTLELFDEEKNAAHEEPRRREAVKTFDVDDDDVDLDAALEQRLRQMRGRQQWRQGMVLCMIVVTITCAVTIMARRRPNTPWWWGRNKAAAGDSDDDAVVTLNNAESDDNNAVSPSIHDDDDNLAPISGGANNTDDDDVDHNPTRYPRRLCVDQMMQDNTTALLNHTITTVQFSMKGESILTTTLVTNDLGQNRSRPHHDTTALMQLYAWNGTCYARQPAGNETGAAAMIAAPVLSDDGNVVAMMMSSYAKNDSGLIVDCYNVSNHHTTRSVMLPDDGVNRNKTALTLAVSSDANVVLAALPFGSGVGCFGGGYHGSGGGNNSHVKCTGAPVLLHHVNETTTPWFAHDFAPGQGSLLATNGAANVVLMGSRFPTSTTALRVHVLENNNDNGNNSNSNTTMWRHVQTLHNWTMRDDCVQARMQALQISVDGQSAMGWTQCAKPNGGFELHTVWQQFDLKSGQWQVTGQFVQAFTKVGRVTSENVRPLVYFSRHGQIFRATDLTGTMNNDDDMLPLVGNFRGVPSLQADQALRITSNVTSLAVNAELSRLVYTVRDTSDWLMGEELFNSTV